MLSSKDALDWVMTKAIRSGRFDAHTFHEPKAAPGKGLTASLWIQDYRAASSGLSATSMRLLVQLRLFVPMLKEPQDDIDRELMGGVDAVFNEIIGDFAGLTGARYVDVHGADGEALSASLGYLQQDSKVFRIADILIPIVLNDVYTEAP